MVWSSWRHFIWDFCLAPGPTGAAAPYQLFFLQEQRRWPLLANRRGAITPVIGRASSTDLVTWRREPDALGPGAPGAWDESAAWPGCVVERDGRWYLFYTGGRHRAAEPGRAATIDIGLGLATSPDRRVWTRHPGNPLPIGGPPGWPAPPWQADPWVLPAPEAAADYLFYVAPGRGPAGEALETGATIRCARATDLLDWRDLGPLTAPFSHGRPRALQVVSLAGRFYLLFSLTAASDPRPQPAWPSADQHGITYLVADHPTGPYRPLDAAPLLSPPYTGGRLLTGPDGRPALLATRERDETGHDLGVVTDPAPLTVAPDGRLTVAAARLWPSGWRPTNEPTAVPAAFVERGLAVGLFRLEGALSLAEQAAIQPVVTGDAAMPRVEYTVAILDGATLTVEQRATLERQALDLALTGQRLPGAPPTEDFASLVLLLPRLTGPRRVEAGARALARALRNRVLHGQLLGPLAPWLTPAELTQALERVIGPDQGAEVVEGTWVDDEDADREIFQFNAIMALVPALTGRERRRALLAALREAGRVARDFENFGRDLGPRAEALARLAPYLLDHDLRSLARAIASASGLEPPAALDWSIAQAEHEQRTLVQRAFLAEPACQRWLGWDDRTIAALLATLSAAERDRLVAEALDCFWHHRYGYHEPAFLSRGLRGAARYLSPAQVAAQLARYSATGDD